MWNEDVQYNFEYHNLGICIFPKKNLCENIQGGGTHEKETSMRKETQVSLFIKMEGVTLWRKGNLLIVGVLNLSSAKKLDRCDHSVFQDARKTMDVLNYGEFIQDMYATSYVLWTGHLRVSLPFSHAVCLASLAN